MSTRAKPELCPALLYDEPEERVICWREESIPAGAWGFVCRSCWEAMLDAAAVRAEWRTD